MKIKELSGAKKSAFPTKIHPELCSTAPPPHGDEWLHEIKFDGYRIVSFVKNKHVLLVSRNEKDWTASFPTVTTGLKNFPAKKIILDGEIVVLDKKGISRFQLLQNAFDQKVKIRFDYFLFDILFYDDYDLTKVPLLQRKEFLKSVLHNWSNKPNFIHYSEHIIGNGDKIFEQACQQGAEGIISKKIDSPYSQYRSKDWAKSKCTHRQEFVIGGYTEPAGARRYFGALLLGYYNSNGQFIYCGHVGTGFNQATLKKLYQLMKPLQQSKTAFLNPPKGKKSNWTKPAIVGEVEFSEWTSDGVLRHPSFQGLREDKNHKEVTKEKMIKSKSKKIVAKSKDKKQTAKKTSNSSTDKTIVEGIVITNPEKFLYSNPNISKLDLAKYYEQIANWILPYITRRLLTILRCPNGAQAECFFQKHINENMPNSIFPKKVKKEEEPYIWIKNISGLIALVQRGVLEIHPWGSNIDNLDKPDQVIFDLDPSDEIDWLAVIECAFSLRDQLQRVGLKSFVKTTGGKGLHIVAPLTPHANWQQVKDFSGNIASELVAKYPHKYIATMSKEKRHNKIFIDYLRNTRGATAIAPYGTRAHVNAPIATPITWRELSRIKSADQFTFANIIKRLTTLKSDPWKGFFDIKQKIKI